MKVRFIMIKCTTTAAGLARHSCFCGARGYFDILGNAAVAVEVKATEPPTGDLLKRPWAGYRTACFETASDSHAFARSVIAGSTSGQS